MRTETKHTDRLLLAIVILLLWVFVRPQPQPPGRYQRTETFGLMFDTATGTLEEIRVAPLEWAHWYWPYRDLPFTSAKVKKQRDIQECMERRSYPGHAADTCNW